MAFSYKTPGVYLEEVVKLPPSVASVETAVPCFFGLTQKARKTQNNDLLGLSKKINSFADYEAFYGLADTAKAIVKVGLNMPAYASLSSVFNNNMYFAVKHYFDNGGGPCYVHSIGNYEKMDLDQKSINAESYKKAILTLDLVDEVTLVVLPDITGLKNTNQIYGVYNQAIQTAASLQDKFVIIDVTEGDDNTDVDALEAKNNFRDKIANNGDSIKYAAAYFPFLQTTYGFDFDRAEITMEFSSEFINAHGAFKYLNMRDYNEMKSIYTLNEHLKLWTEDYFKTIPKGSYTQKINEIHNQTNALLSCFDLDGQNDLLEKGKALEVQIEAQGRVASSNSFDFVETTEKEKTNYIKLVQKRILALYDSPNVPIAGVTKEPFTKLDDTYLKKLPAFLNSIYEAAIKEAFLDISVILPPSPAVAGTYASVDRNKGVWKAPANISLNAVVKPVVALSDLDQGDFNVDAENGKSINCIRQFVGRGTLVWGARTLAGNDNEWKYINVRRFFNMVEESCKNTIGKFVYEPNDANTWVRVKGTIENYLTNLWRVGAMQGAKPGHAFYVEVGLNKTMTQEDILNGILIVEIGLAVVRPAEFIVLRFSHKLADS